MALPACGSGSMVIQVNGVDVDENKWNDTTHELGARLRFEHDCDGPYEFVLIRKRYHNPMEVGAVACNQKWIFSRDMKGTQLGPWHARLTSEPLPAYRYASAADVQDSSSTDEPTEGETDSVDRDNTRTADSTSSDAVDTADYPSNDPAATSSTSSAAAAADTDSTDTF